MKRFISLITMLLVCAAVSAQEQPTFSGKMNKDDIREVCTAVSNWQIDNFANVKHNKAGWHNGALYIGMFHWAEMSNDQKAADFLMQVGKGQKWGLLSRSYHADDICVGQMYIEMYKKHNEEKNSITFNCTLISSYGVLWPRGYR